MGWGRSSARDGRRVLAGAVLAFLLVLDARAGEGAPAPSDYALRHWGTDDGLPSHTITDVKQAPDGYLWMASTAGLIRFDGHRFTVFDQRNAGLTNPRVASLTFLPDGGLRVIGDDFSVLESRSMAPLRFTEHGQLPKGTEPGPPRRPSLVDRFGNVWRTDTDSIEVRRPDGSQIWSHAFPMGTT